jgi:hypothetical protein
MSNAKLFKDAIADAKALREVAVANAKAALEESFAPRIQSMFEKRVMESEELDESDDELDEKVTYEGDKDNLLKSLDETEEVDEGYGAYEYEKGKKAGEMKETSKSEKDAFMEGEDIDLEELFRSLSEEEDLDEYSEQQPGGYKDDRDRMSEEEDLDEEYDLEEILRELEEEDSLEEGEDEMNENTMFEKATGEEEISEVTVDELRDMIQDAIKAALGDAEGDAGEEEMDLDMDMGMDMGGEEGGEDMDLDIDMDAEEGEDEKEKPKKKSKKDELDEIRALYEKKKDEMKNEVRKELDERKRYKMNPKSKDLDEGKDMNAPFGKGGAKSKPGAPYGAAGTKKSGKNGAYSHSLKMKLNEKEENVDEAKKKEKELEEAINVIKALRSQLNEVNLLNAKLIYVNKIFKSNMLNESQKVKVVNSFDKAKTLNEAKNIYEVLKDNIASKSTKAPLRESKNIASSIIGGRTASQPIVADDMITRMQKLAGIIND